MLLSNSLAISHEIIKRVVRPGDTAVDATMGNGNDTLLLAELTGGNGTVYSFDIQEAALESTRKKLTDSGAVGNIKLILDGHQNMDRYVPAGVRAVMFNLGYLPKGDHSIGTRGETTIEALEKSMELLMPGGIIMLVIYYGGDSGFDERDTVLEYIKTIDCRRFTVLVSEFVNQINCPPIAVCIEKNQ